MGGPAAGTYLPNDAQGQGLRRGQGGDRGRDAIIGTVRSMAGVEMNSTEYRYH